MIFRIAPEFYNDWSDQQGKFEKKSSDLIVFGISYTYMTSKSGKGLSMGLEM